MERQMNTSEGIFSYKNTSVCEKDSEIIGIVHAYPSRLNKVPTVSDAFFIPFDRLAATLRLMYRKKLKDTLYIQGLAVKNTYRNQGLDAKLIEHAKARALQSGFKGLSLHVWHDNKAALSALSLYKKMGFKKVASILIARQTLLPHDGGMALLELRF